MFIIELNLTFVTWQDLFFISAKRNNVEAVAIPKKITALFQILLLFILFLNFGKNICHIFIIFIIL